jgi:hypothetical protein
MSDEFDPEQLRHFLLNELRSRHNLSNRVDRSGFLSNARTHCDENPIKGKIVQKCDVETTVDRHNRSESPPLTPKDGKDGFLDVFRIDVDQDPALALAGARDAPFRQRLFQKLSDLLSGHCSSFALKNSLSLNRTASSLATTRRAPEEQCLTHSGAPKQKSHFTATFNAASKNGTDSGHATMHISQPTHLDEFCITHPVFSSLCSASGGQTAQQIGSSQC